MAMDLTNSSRLKENEIVLHPLSYRMNQRWVFEGIDLEKEEGLGQIRDSIDRSRQSNAFRVYIRSALTEQFVSFNREHKQLMQSSYPEEWRLEPRRTGFMQEEQPEFCIEHVKQHKYLSCKEDSSELYLSSEPIPWIIPDPFLSLQHAVNKESQKEGRRTTI